MRPTFAAAVNKPKLFVGIERRMLAASFLVALLIGVAGKTFVNNLAATVAFCLLCAVSLRYTRKDDRILKILFSIRKQKALYDAGKREGSCFSVY